MTNFFSKNLKYLRKKKNIDQQVMAEDLGIAQSTLSCWENGLRSPDLDTITKISKYLNIYDDFITKDLTLENINENDNSTLTQTELLFNKSKNILSDDDRATMEFIMKKTIENYENNKNKE